MYILNKFDHNWFFFRRLLFYKEKKCDLFINEMSIEINFSQGNCRFVFLYNKERHKSFQKQSVIYIYKTFRTKTI